MTLKETLASRNFDTLAAAAEELASANNDLRWALVEARRRLGMTQAELAGTLGVSQPAVASMESMESDPRVSTLERYALALGVRVHHVIEFADGASLDTREHELREATARVSLVPAEG